MGSKGSKPRKPKHSQHLPKVGTKTENQRLMHDEQKAVMSQMGVGSASSGMKIVVLILVVILLLGAISGLIFVWR